MVMRITYYQSTVKHKNKEMFSLKINVYYIIKHVVLFGFFALLQYVIIKGTQEIRFECVHYKLTSVYYSWWNSLNATTLF